MDDEGRHFEMEENGNEYEGRPEATIEELVDIAPIPENKEYKTLDQIYEFFSLEKDVDSELPNLESTIRNNLQDFADAMKNEFSSPNEEWFPLIDIIYNLYIIRSRLTPIPLWLKAFDDFDSFIAHFFSLSIHKNSKSYIIKNIRIFSSIFIKPRRIYEFRENLRQYNPLQFYLADKRTWIILPHSGYFATPGDSTFIDISIINEFIAILKEPPTTQLGFLHATGSAALPGISKAAKLLSAQKALQAGSEVKTGEWVSYIDGDGRSVSGWNHGLSSIYVSYGDYPSTSYTISRWFNESPVVFHINKDKHTATLKRKSMDRTPWFDGKTIPTIRNGGGEGVEIGSEVEISDVDVVYCEKDYQQVMVEWCKQNAPHIRIVSLEVMDLLFYYMDDIRKLARKMGKTDIELLEYLILLSLDKTNK